MPEHYRDVVRSKEHGLLDWCKHCKKYIKTNVKNVDTLEPFKLSGRKGRSFVCSECNREVAFLGIIS